MAYDEFLRGFLIGLTVAVPIGPMAALLIKRTISHGRSHGMATGVGIASADGIYSALAAFGLTGITALLIDLQTPMRVVGGLFLLYLGVRTLRPNEVVAKEVADPPSLRGVFASSLGLTLSNPPTILIFAGIFAGAGFLPAPGEWARALLLVTGVIAGSLTWWTFLVLTAGALRERLGPVQILWINRISGVMIAGFGVVALATAFS